MSLGHFLSKFTWFSWSESLNKLSAWGLGDCVYSFLDYNFGSFIDCLSLVHCLLKESADFVLMVPQSVASHSLSCTCFNIS